MHNKIVMLYAVMLLVLSNPSHAMNIYKSGTQGDLLYSQLSHVLEDITPVFLDARDTTSFVGMVHPIRLLDSSVTSGDINAFVGLIPEGMSQFEGTGLVAFAISGYSAIEDERSSQICAIVFASDRGYDYDTLMHEAAHCKANKYHFDDEFKTLLLSAYHPIQEELDLSRFIGYYHEALAVHFEVLYASLAGRTGDLISINRMAQRQSHNGSYGHRTTLHALNMCSRGDCPASVIEMAEKMLKSPGFIEYFYQDIREIEASGL